MISMLEVVALTSLAGIPIGADMTPLEPGLEVKLSPTTILPYEPVHLVIRWTNLGSGPVRRWIPQVMQEHALRVRVTDAAGSEVFRRWAADGASTVSALVPPGGVVESAVDLSQTFDLSLAGKYTVEAEIGLRGDVYAPDVRTGKLEYTLAAPSIMEVALNLEVVEPTDATDVKVLKLLRAGREHRGRGYLWPMAHIGAQVLALGPSRYRDSAIHNEILYGSVGLNLDLADEQLRSIKDPYLRRTSAMLVVTSQLHAHFGDPVVARARRYIPIARDEVFRPNDIYVFQAEQRLQATNRNP